MYRFNSIDEFEQAFDKAYLEGMEKEENGIEVFSNFEGVALFALRESIAYTEGRIEGLLESVSNFPYEDVPTEVTKEAMALTHLIECYADVMTHKMEELGLL